MSKVFISIDNNHDELPQAEWARLYRDIDFAIRWGGPTVWGAWVSETTSPVQNACWCAELEPHQEKRLRNVLPLIAREYQRNTIAWATVAATEFIDPAPEVDDETGAHHLPAGTTRTVELAGDGSGTPLPAAVEGCICSHTIHAEVPGRPAELNADADCPIHGEFVYCPNCPGVAKLITALTYRCPHCMCETQADVPVGALGPATGNGGGSWLTSRRRSTGTR